MQGLITALISRTPGSAWHLLANECRALGPAVATSKSLDLAIERVIADIGSGQDIRDFLKEADPFKPARKNGRGCSRMFLEFLLKLREQMALQGVLDVPPLQATMLLYDHDAVEQTGQGALRLVTEEQGCYSFVSTVRVQERQGAYVRVTLQRNYLLTWNIATRRDRPADPIVARST